MNKMMDLHSGPIHTNCMNGTQGFSQRGWACFGVGSMVTRPGSLDAALDTSAT